MRSISILTVFLVKVNIPRTRTRFLFPLWPTKKSVNNWQFLLPFHFSCSNYWSRRNGMGGATVQQLLEQEKWNGWRNSLCLLPCWSNHLTLNYRNKIRISQDTNLERSVRPGFHNQPLFSWSELIEDQTKLK